MTTTLLFQGPPRSGKDTCVDILRAEFGNKVNHLEMKTALFEDTCRVFGVTMAWFMDGYDDNKGVPMPELKGRSKRQALIYTSEDLMKPQYGSDVYGTKAAKLLDKDRVNVFSDCGFKDEIVPIMEGSDKIVLVHVVRPGKDFSMDSRRYVPTLGPKLILGNPDFEENDPWHDNNNWFDTEPLDIPSVVLYNSETLKDLKADVLRIWNTIDTLTSLTKLEIGL